MKSQNWRPTSPPGTTFAMSEHGLVGAYAPRAVIIDLLGLHDPIFARHGFSAAELWRRQPDMIWMPHPDHTQMLRDILDSDELWQHYVFYPDAFTYGVALRRDGPNYAILSELFQKLWQATTRKFDRKTIWTVSRADRGRCSRLDSSASSPGGIPRPDRTGRP